MDDDWRFHGAQDQIQDLSRLTRVRFTGCWVAVAVE
jgi:hypothetical protein